MHAARDPETMTPSERDAEVANVFAQGVIRAVRLARSRSTRDINEDAESSPPRLELTPHAGLSVAARPAG